jgi:predicted dehydrogenase
MPAPPALVGVAGGGRWARVIVGVLAGVLPASTRILIASPRNQRGMRAYAEAQGFGDRVLVCGAVDELAAARPDAAIVANASRDHEQTAMRLIAASVPVLVEKPFALTAEGARRLIERAHEGGVPIAAALVLRFAPFVTDLAQLPGATESARVLVFWSDAAAELRHGEPKRYDPGVPVIADVLPHVIGILRDLGCRGAFECGELRLEDGGAIVHLEGSFGDRPSVIALARNAERRQRRIVIETSERLEVDFVVEPATIRRNWEPLPTQPRAPGPLASMLAAFLRFAVDRRQDERLRADVALDACEVVDRIMPSYERAQAGWLGARLAQETPDSGIRYALREMLARAGPELPLDPRLDQIAWERLRASAHGQEFYPFDRGWMRGLTAPSRDSA